LSSLPGKRECPNIKSVFSQQLFLLLDGQLADENHGAGIHPVV